MNRRDNNRCSCGRVAVDGGHGYLKRSFQNADDFEELSIIQDKAKQLPKNKLIEIGAIELDKNL